MTQHAKKLMRIAGTICPLIYIISTLFLPFFCHSMAVEDSFGTMKTAKDYMMLIDCFSNKDVGGGLLAAILFPVFLMFLTALLVGLLCNKASCIVGIIAASVTMIHSISLFLTFDTLVKQLELDVMLLTGHKLSLSWGFYIALIAAIAVLVLSILLLKGNTVELAQQTRLNEFKVTAPVTLGTNPQNATHSILCVNGEFANASFPIAPNETMIIGRDSKVANVVVVAPKISRKHCSIRFDAQKGMFEVVDFSSNGTFTQSGNRLIANMATPLPVGTVISLGSDENQFRLV